MKSSKSRTSPYVPLKDGPGKKKCSELLAEVASGELARLDEMKNLLEKEKISSYKFVN